MYSKICLNILLVIYNEVHNETMYSCERGKMSSLINRLVYEFLCFAPDMIITILFCEVSHFTVRWIAHQNYSRFYCGMKIGKMHWFESVFVWSSSFCHFPSICLAFLAGYLCHLAGYGGPSITLEHSFLRSDLMHGCSYSRILLRSGVSIIACNCKYVTKCYYCFRIYYCHYICCKTFYTHVITYSSTGIYLFFLFLVYLMIPSLPQTIYCQMQI